MTTDLGVMALSMLRVEGWGEHVHYVRAGWDMAERIKPLMSVKWEEAAHAVPFTVALPTMPRPGRQCLPAAYRVA